MKFNSEEKLDELNEILLSNVQNSSLTQTIKFYKKIEYFIIGIHDDGFKKGYEKGVEIKKTIKKI